MCSRLHLGAQIAPPAPAPPDLQGGSETADLPGAPGAQQPVTNFPVLINSRISPSHYQAVGGTAGAARLPGSEPR